MMTPCHTNGIRVTSVRWTTSEDSSDQTSTTTAASSSSSSSAAAASDILNSPAFLQRKLDVLKSDEASLDDQIVAAKAQLEEQKMEWEPQFNALEKEFQNIQNRFSRQGSKGDEDAVLNVARAMMNVLDNYDRAFQSIVPETDDEKAIEAQYRATYDHMLNILRDLGVTVIETVGKEFDYELHQAVLQRPDDTYEEGIVCEELQKGYVLNGKRLVRAAMVSVAA